MSDVELLHAGITSRIIKAFYRVYDELGYGFLEKVYCAALEIEFQNLRLAYRREAPLEVYYRGRQVGFYRADFLVEEKVVVEVKASRALTDADRKQLLNNLRATRIELGIQLHFGPAAVFKRMIVDNHRKRSLEVVV